MTDTKKEDQFWYLMTLGPKGGIREVWAEKDNPVKICKVNNQLENAKENGRLIAAAPRLLKALLLANEFLDSLPEGWLGNTTGDIGALNDFFIESSKALATVEGKGGNNG